MSFVIVIASFLSFVSHPRRIVAERVPWEALLSKLKAINKVEAEVFAEKGVQQFLALPLAHVPENPSSDDGQTKRLFEDLLLQVGDSACLVM
jgi:hypothetical protein